MNPFKNEQKEQIISWVQKLRNTTTHVLISDFCYECILTGVHKTKTLIVIPEMLEKEGIIAIDKPIEKIELVDIIQVTKRLRQN